MSASMNSLTTYLDEKYYLTKSRKKHVLLRDIEYTPYCYIVI